MWRKGDCVRVVEDLSTEMYDVAQDMVDYAGKEAMVTRVFENWYSDVIYRLNIDGGVYVWYDELLEPLITPDSFYDSVMRSEL